MASSSCSVLMASSQSHSPMYTGKWEYDVFVCFRGADTRNGFTSHLVAALSDKQIKAFIDDKLQKTESIDKLISILRRSALSIVIFSENFADSSWCLEEVATISQTMEEFGHWVLPVFYKVHPSDVVEDFGRYYATIELKHGASNSPDVRKRWKDGLKVVANFAGHTSDAIKTDSELVTAIVNDVLKRLLDMSPRVKSDTLIGMDARVSEVEELLAMNMDDFRIIGFWGMGGVGKTTLAKACYNRFISSVNGIKHHFVLNISDKCEKQSGIGGVVQELYSILLSEDNLSCNDLDINYRRVRLSRLRVFLLLDNVETSSQLEQLLLGDFSNTVNLFALGSRIIVTTRNRKVLEHAGANKYHVECLHSHESLQLFGIHAFRQSLPPNDWMRLSDVAVSYCKGSPLAIKVLGGALFRKDKNYWESFLGALGKMPKPEIHDVLRRSYDELGIVEKRVFLDTACFLNRVSKSYLIKYFSIYYRFDHVIEDLIDKSLFICVSDKEDKKIEVHDLLRDLAWSFVNEEEKLDNRSRLNNAADIRKLLTIREAKTFKTFNRFQAKEIYMSHFERVRATEGISLDLSTVDQMHLEADAFEGMSSLRFLSFFYSGKEYPASKFYVPYGGLDSLPDSLRWLRWEGFPSQSLPLRFSPENLFRLAIRFSPQLEQCWEVQPNLVNLVELDLSYCINLVATPRLSGSPNLEYLCLRGCDSLIELPSGVEDLEKLISLDARYCMNLRSLPAKLNSKSLKHFFLSNCPKVTRCPEIISRELVALDLMETPVVALPGAIYKIKQGDFMRIYGEHITSFPVISASLNLFLLCHTTIREMDIYDDDDDDDDDDDQASAEMVLPRFAELDLLHNPRLKSLSRNLWKMVSGKLTIEDCPSIENLPDISQPVDGFTELVIRRCRNLKSLPSGIYNLKSLKLLCFLGTAIKSLPSCIEELDQLFYVDLSYCESLECIPNIIHKLANLAELLLVGCKSIRSLPELPPNIKILKANNCDSLQVLPSNISNLCFQHLRLDDCPQLESTSLDEIVANFPDQALSQLSQVGFHYSGSEVPEWFHHRSIEEENYVRMELPVDCAQLKGIAFGVVYSLDQPCGSMHIVGACFSETEGIWRWNSFPWEYQLVDGSSDRVFLWCDKTFCSIKDDEGGARFNTYAGLDVYFRFVAFVEFGGVTTPYHVKKCGVSLLY